MNHPTTNKNQNRGGKNINLGQFIKITFSYCFISGCVLTARASQRQIKRDGYPNHFHFGAIVSILLFAFHK